MKALKYGILVASALIVAACGGSSSGSFETGGTARLAITVETSQVPANPQGFQPNPDRDFTIEVSVRFTRADGTIVTDGTSVTLSSSNSARGVVSSANTPDQTGSTASTGTSGGVARFLFTSGAQTGSVNLSASASNPSGSGSISSSITIQVVEASDDSERVTLTINDSELPQNILGFQPAPDSQFSTQINVKVLNSAGDVAADGTQVNLGVDNAGRAMVSPLSNVLQAGADAVATVSGGFARFLVTSGSNTGPVALTASSPDDQGGGAITSQPLVIQIVPFDGGSDRISISAVEAELPANVLDIQPSVNSQFSTQLNVSVIGADGNPVADGTSVVIGVDDASKGVVSTGEDPLETSASAETQTQAGTARFIFTAGRETGSIVLVASTDGDSGEAILSDPVSLTILPNEADESRLRVSGPATLPSNEDGVAPFFGSPFINELTIEYLGPDGQPGQVVEGEIAVAIAPVNVAAFSTLDDPETEDVNEFVVLMGSAPVGMTAGVSTIFIHSFDLAGEAVVTVTATDAGTGELFSARFTVEVVDGAANFLPAQLDYIIGTDPVYIQGSGGATAKPMQLLVSDAGDNAVPNPEGTGFSYNNVVLTLDAPEGSGARLSGTGAEGSVNGEEIAVQTLNGIAQFSLQAGTETGTHTIVATVDRADNNVDNDLLDPLTAETTIAVGDGRLFSVELVNPILNAIRINRVTTGIDTDQEPIRDPDTGILVPPDPDGTYSLTITAQGSDKVGNPVLPGTQVNFGKIDAPLTPDNPPFFVFSGIEGDPEEAGFLFDALDTTEGFMDDLDFAEEAVEPGDTLALFGKSVAGNREHEASRIVDSVVDDDTLLVTEAFNPNNATGQIVDDGAVIPWVIGRSRVGVVDELINLGEDGRGSVQLTYPIDAVGRPIVLWTQGTRQEFDQNTKTVAEVESMVFPGIAPLQLTATPNQVAGNQSVNITLCLRDGIGTPINGVFINAAVGGGTGSAAIDGIPLGVGSDQTANATSGNGCVVTELTTQGLIPDEDDLIIVFFVGSAQDTVTVVAPGSAALSVTPSRVVDNVQGPINIRLILRLTDASGNPISSVPLSGECEDPAGGVLRILNQPGLTDSEGLAEAIVQISLFDCDVPVVGEFQCVFTTQSGAPTGTFTAVGLAPEDIGIISPPCD